MGRIGIPKNRAQKRVRRHLRVRHKVQGTAERPRLVVYRSLKHITALRPDLIKVDRGLVAGLDHDPARAAVIETLGIFASRLDAWLLAEGVETAGELERLRRAEQL